MHEGARGKGLGAGRTLKEFCQEILGRAWSINTYKQDGTARRHFTDFCVRTRRRPVIVSAEEGSEEFRMQDEMLMEFVAFLGKRGLDYQTCRAYLLSVGRQFLTEVGHIQISRHIRPMLCVSGLERMQGEGRIQPKKETPAMTIEILRRGIEALKRMFGGVEATRMKAIICVGITFMLRISEIVESQGTRHQLRWNGVEFMQYDTKEVGARPRAMRIMIRSSKRDKAPMWRRLGATWSVVCPVRAMYEYKQAIEGMKVEVMKDGNLFGRIGMLKEAKGEEVKRAIQGIAKVAGVEGRVEDFTTKSMRVGGVTTMTDKDDVKGHLVEKHGRWKSKTWNKVYSKQSQKTDRMIAHIMGI